MLISNSTLYDSGYLDHVETESRDFLGGAADIAFVPFAMYDWRSYAIKTQVRFRAMGYRLASVHDVSNARRPVDRANAIFVGGGNTFRLLKGLYDAELLEAIRERVKAGVPYLGSSAGSIVACPSLKTTKDMPVVPPPSLSGVGAGAVSDQPTLPGP